MTSRGAPLATDVSAEALAYWFLRLNGFLTIQNFVVHPDTGQDQETDVDVLGVRFPFRAENLVKPMRDHEVFTQYQDKPLFVIAEVTVQPCKLNGPWTNPARQNMLRVLRAIGAFSAHHALAVAAALYGNGYFEDSIYCVSLVCVGRERSSGVAQRYPNVPQLTLEHLARFIYGRFREYRRQKVAHPQWDDCGHRLWNLADGSRTFEEFFAQLRVSPR
jgi:hypothetical protein